MGEAVPGPGPCSFSTRRSSLVSEDELQEEDHLGKQSFVPKAFFTLVARIIIRKYFFPGKWRLGLRVYRVNGGSRLSYYNYTIEV